MKKLTTILMTGVLAVGGIATAFADTEYKTATLHDAKVRFNDGEIQNIRCYNIDGYNFVRARDITNELDVAVYAIQNGTVGVMVDPHNKPTSTTEAEKLAQKTAKVKVEKGELIYDGSVSEAECFLLNGRYYFKLADFADASKYAKEGTLELVNIEAKAGIVTEPFMPTFYGIEIDWDDTEKVIDVTYTKIDLQEMFDDIRSGKVLTLAEEKESKTDMGAEEDTDVVSKKFQVQAPLTSAPEEGEILANILVDDSEAAYLDNAMTQPNIANYTVPYSDTEAGMIGQCTWYARGRMLETVGEHIKENPFYNPTASFAIGDTGIVEDPDEPTTPDTGTGELTVIKLDARDDATPLAGVTFDCYNAKGQLIDTGTTDSSRIVCYDILDLGKSLKTIGMLIMLDSILNRVMKNRKNGRRTWVYIDEIYLFFANEYSSTFLSESWKRFRKYGALATGITQNVSDCLRSDMAKTMFSNSEFLILLNQSANDRKELARLFHISGTQMNYITDTQAGRGLLKVKSSLVPFINEFPKDTELYRLMTTKPEDR